MQYQTSRMLCTRCTQNQKESFNNFICKYCPKPDFLPPSPCVWLSKWSPLAFKKGLASLLPLLGGTWAWWSRSTFHRYLLSHDLTASEGLHQRLVSMRGIRGRLCIKQKNYWRVVRGCSVDNLCQQSFLTLYCGPGNCGIGLVWLGCNRFLGTHVFGFSCYTTTRQWWWNEISEPLYCYQKRSSEPCYCATLESGDNVLEYPDPFFK